MQMQAVFGDKRPVVVIVDEIDGLAMDAVDELIAMIKATPERGAGVPDGEGDGGAAAGAGGPAVKGKGRGKAGASGGSGGSGSNFKDKNQAITRPVICICNDMVRVARRLLYLWYFC